MTLNLQKSQIAIYEKLGIHITNFKTESESQEYSACQFEIGEVKIISRHAKVTPKKKGQFVTFWKRSERGPIEPFSEVDNFDFLAINVSKDNVTGLFVFPKSILIEKGIISSSSKEGKRALRVYPNWDKPNSQQAIRTQKWQLNYFHVINDSTFDNKIFQYYKIQ